MNDGLSSTVQEHQGRHNLTGNAQAILDIEAAGGGNSSTAVNWGSTAHACRGMDLSLQDEVPQTKLTVTSLSSG